MSDVLLNQTGKMK